MLVWLVLWCGWGLVTESDKGLFDVPGHAEVDMSAFVVPIEC